MTFLKTILLAALTAPTMAANPYANGNPESDQTYVPENKTAYAAGYIQGGGCNDTYRLPKHKEDTYTTFDNGLEDYSSGEFDGQVRGADVKWCKAQIKILSKAGICLHKLDKTTVKGLRPGSWGARLPECVVR